MVNSSVSFGSLVVAKQVRGNTVWYTVCTSDNGTTKVKTIRFSELVDLHKSLLREVPSLPCRLPRKTLTHKTSDAFVESRRQGIQMYLRTVASHALANKTETWQTFMAGASDLEEEQHETPAPIVVIPTEGASYLQEDPCEAASPNVINEPEGASYLKEEQCEAPSPKIVIEPEAQVSIVESSGSEGEEAKPEEMSQEEGWLNISHTLVQKDMIDSLRSKWGHFAAAKKTKQQVEEVIAAGEEAVREAEADAQVKSAFQAESAALLRLHYTSLKDFDNELIAKKAQRSLTASQQTQLLQRLEEQFSSASEAVQKALLSLETSRRAGLEAAEDAKANVAAATAVEDDAETAYAAAVASHAALLAAVTLLKEQTEARMLAARKAEHELSTFLSAEKAVASELSCEEAACRNAENDFTSAAAAVAAHIKDAASRSRVHEVKISRAKDQAASLAALRDMQTRGNLLDGDRELLDPAEKAAADSAEAAAEKVSEAMQLWEVTKMADEEALQKLRSAAAEKEAHLRRRKIVVATLASRMEDCKDAARKASRAATSAASAHKTTLDVEIQQGLVLETLAKSLPECATELADARAAVVAAKKKGEDDLEALRRVEEADIRWLQVTRHEEAEIQQAIDEARLTAAEAHEDAVENTEETVLQAGRLVREELDVVDAAAQSHTDMETEILAKAQENVSQWSEERETLEADLHRAQLQLAVAEETLQATKSLAQTMSRGS